MARLPHPQGMFNAIGRKLDLSRKALL